MKNKRHQGFFYETSSSCFPIPKNSKLGQVTIFVIIGLVLVAGVLLVVLWLDYDRVIRPPTIEENPKQTVEQCINEKVEESVEKIFENNGYIVPSELYKNYLGNKVPYLCFTPNPYSRCRVMNPVLIDHLESEILGTLESRIDECFNILSRELRSKGYSVNMGNEFEYSFNLLPGKAETTINRVVTIQKGEELKKFSLFEATYNTRLYDIAIIIHQIIKEEALYCNSEYVEIMASNTWVDINKFQTGDSVKIYTVTDTINNRSIEFAVRGCVIFVPK